MVREVRNNSWERAVKRRRLLLSWLVLAPTAVAAYFMAHVLPHRGVSALGLFVVLLFATLFAWISIGFWASVAGFFSLLWGPGQLLVTKEAKTKPVSVSGKVKTAVVIPVYNEPVDRVFAGLYSVYRSLQEAGGLEFFHFYILSDSSDPDIWIEEEAAWHEFSRLLDGAERVFYRNRRVNVKRKSGNIADFCRRWGYRYRYMIVFDADSLMSGPTLLRMVAAMEKNPTVGILQTFPTGINGATLFARLQQFANHLFGPMFAAGLHFWQLGDSQYWGHNAIIRVKPFMNHCALPVLSGRPPLGGEILSHDFVEAALMRRAGWGVWPAYGLGGSYEQPPPNLLDELKRDRRWCQGNMQHLRLLFARGVIPAHRALFLAGAMAYLSGLLWFLFLFLSTAQAIFETVVPPAYFPPRHVLFPRWPVWDQGWAVILGITTAVLLFLPKLLGVLLVLLKRRAKEFGGGPKLAISTIAEAVLSSLLAPIRMIFYTSFVLSILLGRKVGWGTQQRGARGTSWGEALRFHGAGMALGLVWTLAVLLTNRSFFLWLTPILFSLILAVPLSVWSSRITAGRRFHEAGLFRTPAETAPPRELLWMQSYRGEYRPFASVLSKPGQQGFLMAVVDPCIHALHLSLLRGERKYCPQVLERRRRLRQKALDLGPDGLLASEKRQLLCDPSSLAALHEAVWMISDTALAANWGLCPSPGLCTAAAGA
ncbi:MAG: glucans biosynthesis glucosyltransferase MdoH [Syntrophobacteraceae bacterium]|nr:glucans biosynthesis glucosyltransferase MdoH [Syntrophobacteraceae bacterium]